MARQVLALRPLPASLPSSCAGVGPQVAAWLDSCTVAPVAALTSEVPRRLCLLVGACGFGWVSVFEGLGSLLEFWI